MRDADREGEEGEETGETEPETQPETEDILYGCGRVGTEEYSRSLSLHVRFLHPPGRGPRDGPAEEILMKSSLTWAWALQQLKFRKHVQRWDQRS